MADASEHFMDLALCQAREALAAGEFPVGCVAVAGGRVLASGARRGTRAGGVNEVDHAEVLTLRRLAGIAPAPDPADVTLYATMEPCLMCLAAITLSGIGAVVYGFEDIMGGATGVDPAHLPLLYRQRRPEIRGGVRRAESLVLFQSFFRRPENRYWAGSPLALYTLSQKPE
jgi:tRNA(adenine34) deaminase